MALGTCFITTQLTRWFAPIVSVRERTMSSIPHASNLLAVTDIPDTMPFV